MEIRTAKILVGGEGGVGRTTLLLRYIEGRFKADTKMTIGLDYSFKNIEIEDHELRMLFYDFAGQERFRFMLEGYIAGANAAILAFDLTRPITLDNIEQWVNLFRKNDPNLPIIFIGLKADLIYDIMVDDDYVLQFLEAFNLSDYIKTSCKTGENVEYIFEVLARRILELEPLIKPISPIRPAITSFKVNEHLTLRLEHGITNIYVNNQQFRQCKYLLLNIPMANVQDYDYIDSIDEAAEVLDRSLEGSSRGSQIITPEAEFWGHCSNLQAWHENNYDTRILHRNLAFPLLRRLTQAGDAQAKKVFSEEIARRLECSHQPVIEYLLNGGYVEYLTNDDFLSLEFDLKSFNSDLLQKIAQLYLSRDLINPFMEKYDKVLEDFSDIKKLIIQSLIREMVKVQLKEF